MTARRRFLPFASVLLLVALALPATAASPPTPVIQLRETLGRALGEHTYLALEAMRSVIQGSADPTPLVDALEDNSATLESAFGGIYGAAAGTEFGRLWRQHVTALVTYANARKAGNEASAQSALTTLATYRRDFTAFLTRTDPGLGGEHEAVALQLHIQQLVAFADARFESAFQAERVAYAHMFELGDHFARAISKRFSQRFQGANVAFSPSGELRMDLGRLLGEHLILAAQAMRAGIDRSPDAEAATAALDENAADLSDVIARVYGPAAGEGFARVWAPHIERYLAYVAAIVDSDTAAKEQALAALRAYPAQIASFLVAANPRFPRVAVTEMIGHHVESLIEVVDRYAAGDIAGSVDAVRTAHNHMFEVSAALTRGIVAQFPGRYLDLDHLPATDLGDGAAGAERALPLVAMFFALFGLSLAFFARRAAVPTATERAGHGPVR
jgi:hypothetical protein